MQERTKLAIFDFDGTLTDGHLWVGVAKHHKEKRINRLGLYTYFLSHIPLWLGVKIKVYPDGKSRAKWGEDLSALFRGLTRQEISDAFNWIADNYFMPSMRSDLMRIMQQHREKGEKIVLLSGMFKDILEIIGQKIGVDYVIGTNLEYVNNRCTGRIIRPLCFGEDKVKYLNEFIEQQGLEVDLSGSAAYADSIHDLPVFELVGVPAAVYPDERLYKLAAGRKWRIIDNNRNL
jgi:HAD superfamily hydrolase (TIGR01490 family)